MVVTELLREPIEYFNCDPGFQVLLGLRERFQLLSGRHHRLRAVHLACLALRIRPNLRKEAGAMKIDRGIEVRLIEGIDEQRPTLGMWPGLKSFRTTAPFFPSTKARSLVWRARDLVNSIKS